MSSFEPKIVAFLCNWCSYEGADKAGNAQVNLLTNPNAPKISFVTDLAAPVSVATSPVAGSVPGTGPATRASW